MACENYAERKKYSDFIKTYMRYVKNGGIVNV